VLVIGKILQKLAQSAKRHPPRKGLVDAVCGRLQSHFDCTKAIEKARRFGAEE
jgi:hypothetical protein